MNTPFQGGAARPFRPFATRGAATACLRRMNPEQQANAFVEPHNGGFIVVALDGNSTPLAFGVGNVTCRYSPHN